MYGYIRVLCCLLLTFQANAPLTQEQATTSTPKSLVAACPHEVQGHHLPERHRGSDVRRWRFSARSVEISEGSFCNIDSSRFTAASAVATADAEVALNSTPSGADIEVDGAFVGSTPSTIGIAPGDHVITIDKKGFKPWERKLR